MDSLDTNAVFCLRSTGPHQTIVSVFFRVCACACESGWLARLIKPLINQQPLPRDRNFIINIIGASVSEPPLVDSTDALSRYIYIYIYIYRYITLAPSCGLNGRAVTIYIYIYIYIDI